MFFRDFSGSPVGFPCGSAGKESACNVGDLGSIPGLGRSPGEGKGYSCQYSGLENSLDCIVHGVAKSWTRLSDFHSFISLAVQWLRLHASTVGDAGSVSGWATWISHAWCSKKKKKFLHFKIYIIIYIYNQLKAKYTYRYRYRCMTKM